jgi:hypothetical protein
VTADEIHAYLVRRLDGPLRYPEGEPVLWAVRLGDGPFRDGFTFTPEGRRLQPS